MFDILTTNYAEQLLIFAQALIAALLGGIIGFEREYADKPAGLRTHAFIASAACLLIGLGSVMISHFAVETAPDALRTDPLRIVEAIVTGVAFLGAGTIFRSPGADTVKGLTTAASMLLVAGIGIATALEQTGELKSLWPKCLMQLPNGDTSIVHPA